LKIPSEITFETTETNWVCMIVFLCALLDMYGNHHHHHKRTDLGGIMSITYLPLGHLCHAPLCKILNTPVMSVCLVKQNDGTWVEKHQRILFNVYKRFF